MSIAKMDGRKDRIGPLDLPLGALSELGITEFVIIF